MQSLKTRLENCRKEVLDYTKYHGRSEAMDKFDIKTYDSFARWLEEETGEKMFGFRPVLGVDRNTSLGDQLVDAFLRKVAYMETERAKQVEIIKTLRWQLAQRKERDDVKVMAILTECRI